jgi:hypothetical protein
LYYLPDIPIKSAPVLEQATAPSLLLNTSTCSSAYFSLVTPSFSAYLLAFISKILSGNFFLISSPDTPSPFAVPDFFPPVASVASSFSAILSGGSGEPGKPG